MLNSFRNPLTLDAFGALCLFAAAGPAAGDTAEPQASGDFLHIAFEEPLDEDWVLEGHGRAETADGRLVLQEGGDTDGIVLWHRRELPADFRATYAFTTSNTEGLLIAFFCAQSLDPDKDLFAGMPERKANFRALTRGTLASYHLSLHRFFPTGQHNPDNASNLRRNPPFAIVASHVPDPATEPGRVYEVVIEKRGTRIRTWVDGKGVHDFTDDGTHGPPLSRGRFGFRVRGSTNFQAHIDRLRIDAL